MKTRKREIKPPGLQYHLSEERCREGPVLWAIGGYVCVWVCACVLERVCGGVCVWVCVCVTAGAVAVIVSFHQTHKHTRTHARRHAGTHTQTHTYKNI